MINLGFLIILRIGVEWIFIIFIIRIVFWVKTKEKEEILILVR